MIGGYFRWLVPVVGFACLRGDIAIEKERFGMLGWMRGRVQGIGTGGERSVVVAQAGREAGRLVVTGFGSEFDDRSLTDDSLGTFYYLARNDAVLHVVANLFFAMAVGFIDGALHGASNGVGIENGAAVDVASRTADGLD